VQSPLSDCTESESFLAIIETKEREQDILFEGVDREWKVRKHALRSCSVGPTGILYIGYLHDTREGTNHVKIVVITMFKCCKLAKTIAHIVAEF
jgi:thiaminase